MAGGERVIAPIGASYLRVLFDVQADSIYSPDVMTTDSKFGGASVNISATRERIKSSVLPLFDNNEIIVAGGYAGKDKEGRNTTLGRSGSDTSATAYARALSVWFQNITVFYCKGGLRGVLSAHPKYVENAQLIAHLLYDEAIELAAMGGGVINQDAIQHLVPQRIPLQVLDTDHPDEEGTLIDGHRRVEDPPVKVITALEDLNWIRFPSTRITQSRLLSIIPTSLEEAGFEILSPFGPYSRGELNFVVKAETNKKESPGSELEIERLKGVLEPIIRGESMDQKGVRIRRAAAVGIIGGGVSSGDISSRVERALETISGHTGQIGNPRLNTLPYCTTILLSIPHKVPEIVRAFHKEFYP